ncbi:alpha/beta hydrolase [Proteus faecis]|uniref:Alpha/beta hydrolase n=1 Tax=Proteus faecis TaxID=2050967 RepID=A0AAW7CPE7_9GAMM|nr:alpha/beta fold hydrolase [Proteus faecis]MDL5165846.1 alpha/beta hydrolase [Proteus faecis]MDL5273890.1 alpha/beta hydrolase [Proteus faecis]MDL5277460.1 alpha/beta hydrolase [Proteus faecis]MDL5306449.1 alpha/beta hydrolase [Proteus faecis]MDL5310017.1 alpha/beta hydrolase [Proteus faecis]
MKGKRLFIIHGYTASPEDNWFPWLKEKLEALGYHVDVPDMPESNSPDPKRWQQRLIDANIKLDEDTILVGHSLGCITLLRFLSEQASENTKIGGYILVAGFNREQDNLLELNSHICEDLDYNKLIKISDKRVSVISSNDPAVDPQASKDLANSLQTKIFIEDNAGHFLDRDGYTELPILLDIINNN